MTHWSRLERELDGWAELQQTAELWWRDDDAERPTPQLHHLLSIGELHQVPTAIAVPPANAESSLVDTVNKGHACTVMQHGYAHINHAAPEEKKSELGPDRPLQATLDELSRGIERMRHMFGDCFLPVMVPPWNRISDSVLGGLQPIGFCGISTYLPRDSAVEHGLQRCNTHVDIIDWRNQRRFVGTEVAVDLLIAHLSAKRSGQVDQAEPTGLLTHHLQHDRECWKFLDQLLAFTRHHPAATWVPARAAFLA